MNVVAVSLFGSGPKYCDGVLRLIQDAAEVYPDFTVRLYVDESVPMEVLRSAEAAGAQLRMMPVEPGYSGTFWRFDALSDPDADVVLLRDADSRITRREASAVRAWLATEKHFHIMRDHPRHTAHILAGMWGARGGVAAWVAAAGRQFPSRTALGSDQAFLRVDVYPKIHTDAVVHDSVFSVERQRLRFPTARINGEYVGEIVEVGGCSDPAFREMCVCADKSFWIRARADTAWRIRRIGRRLLRRA